MLCSQTILQSSNNRLLEQLQCEEPIEFKVILTHDDITWIFPYFMRLRPSWLEIYGDVFWNRKKSSWLITEKVFVTWNRTKYEIGSKKHFCKWVWSHLCLKRQIIRKQLSRL